MYIFDSKFQKMIGNEEVKVDPEVEASLEHFDSEMEKVEKELFDDTKPFEARFVGVEVFFENSNRLSNSIKRIESALEKRVMLSNFKNILSKYSLSAPIAAAMRAVPVFDKMAHESFPTDASLDVIAVSETSPLLSNAIEALEGMMTSSDSTETVDPMVSEIRDAVSNFDMVLSDSAYQAEQLEAALVEAKKFIEALDVDEDVIASLKVNTLSSEGFEKVLGKLEQYIVTVSQFDASEFRENPEKLKEEIDGLNDLVDDVSHVFGITNSEYGLTFIDKAKEFTPSESTFGEHDLSKTLLMFYLDKAWSIINQVKIICEKRGEFVEALSSECDNMPEADSAYCADDHCCMIKSYIALVSKLVTESIVVASRLVSVVSTVKNSDMTPANSDEEEDKSSS